MIERPIPFNAPMMRALLGRNKSQTRRPILPQPQPTPIGWRFVSEDAGFGWSGEPPMDYFAPVCPYGQPGDRLWVQEEWGVAELSFDDPYTKAHYSADGAYRVIPGWHKATEFISPDLSFQYCTAATMPRWASRALLEITKLRVERVADISDVDAIDEGMLTLPNPPEIWAASVLARSNGQRPPLGESPRQRCRRFWDSLYEDSGLGWNANPWVWVVEFKRVEG